MSQKFSIVVLIVLMVAGCTNSGPSEAEVGTRVAAKFQAEATAAIELETAVAATVYAKQTANAPTPTPTPTDTPTPTPTPTEIPLGTSNLFIEYILDGSGSMYQQLPNGTTKLEVAQNLLTERLQAFRPETNIGLRVYGHRLPWEGQEEESCQDIELVAPVQPGQIEKIATWLETFEPKGMTPLAAALEQAVEDMDFDPAHINAIIMLSDGIESCEGDPCGLVAELQEQGINFKMHVIGLDVDEPTREQLACIAEAAGGQYHDADNQQDLSEALETVREDVTEDELIVPHGVDTPTPLPTPTPTETPVPTETPIPPTPVPLGEQIAFISERREGRGEVYIMNTDGTALTRLTDNSEQIAYEENPAWSPDGRKIAVQASTLYGHVIDIINRDGSGRVRLTDTSTTSARQPSWSPNGSQIVFQCYSQTFAELCVMNSDGSGLRHLTNNIGWDPSWSPNGSRIVFTSNQDKNLELYLMNIDGSETTRLTNDPGDDLEGTWSPDGNRIAFTHEEEIYIINADGTGMTNITNNPAEEGQPSWSPNGQQIAFSSDRNGNLDIYIMNIDGTGVIQLTNDPATDWQPAWSPR